MALETEIKKVAVNLQQLTDAVVAMTALMQVNKPVVVPKTDPSVQSQASDMVDTSVTIPATTGDGESTGDTAIVKDNNQPMTMVEANAELNKVVSQMGDGGAAIKQLLSTHNAITLAQIPVENYRALIDEAQALVPAS